MGDIGINVPGLVAQLVCFFLLFGLLTVVLYKPVRRMLDERAARIKESMEQTEQIKEQMAKTEEQVKEQLGAARREGQDILAQAAQMGERLKEEARGEARQEAEVIVARARTEIRCREGGQRDTGSGEASPPYRGGTGAGSRGEGLMRGVAKKEG